MEKNIKGDLRPNDYEYSLLSRHVYGNQRSKPIDGDKFVTKYRTWSVILTRKTMDGYFGAVYRCDETKQFVIAHRGTNSLVDMFENFRGIVLNQYSGQKEAAFLLVELIVEQIRNQKPDYTLSFTGHSLGAFLAELSVFFARAVLKFPNVHAVTFESPGSMQSMLTLPVKLDGYSIESLIKDLDIIGYVCYPNLINVSNTHVGTVYAINIDVADNFATLTMPVLRLVNGHGINGVVKWLEMSIVNDDPKCTRLYMSDWPKGFNQLRIFFKYAMFEKGIFKKNSSRIHFYNIPRLPPSLRNKGRCKEAEDCTSPTCIRVEKWMIQQENRIKLRYYGNFKVVEALNGLNRLPVQNFSKPLQEFLRLFYQKIQYICKNNEKATEAVNEVLSETLKGFEMPLDLIKTLLSYEIQKNKVNVEEVCTSRYNSTLLNMHDFRMQLSCWLEKTGFTVDDLITESVIYEALAARKFQFRNPYDLPPLHLLRRSGSF